MAGLGELDAMKATLLADGDECDASSESSCATSDASSLAGGGDGCGDEWDNLVASACAALRESKLATRARQQQIARNDCTLAELAAEQAAEDPADPRAAPSRPLPFRRRARGAGDGGAKQRSFPLPPPASVTLGALRGETSARVDALLTARVAAREALRGTARRLRRAVGEEEEEEDEEEEEGSATSAETWASPPAATAALEAAFDAHAHGVADAAREADGVRLELGVAAAETAKVCRQLAAETAAASGPAEAAAATLAKPSEEARALLERAASGVRRAAAVEARLAELNETMGPHAVQRERAERLAERARGGGAAVQALLGTQRRLREAYEVAVQMSIPVACGRPDIFETALQDVVIYPPRELPDYMGTTVAPPNASLAATVAADTRAALERRLNNVALTAGRTAAAVLGTLPQPPSEDSDTEADDSDTADTATTATTTATDPFPRALTEPQETPSHSPPPIAPPRSGGSGYRSCRLAARSEARPEEPRRTAAAAAAAAAAASASSLPASFLALLDGADVRRHAEAFERHGVCDEATLNQLTRHDLARVGLLPAEVHAVLSSRASPSGAVDARAASHAPEAAKGGRAGAESVAPSRPVPGQGPMFAGSHEAAAATAAADPLSAAGRAGGSASPLQGRSRGGRLWRAPGRLASSDGDARKVDAPSYQRLLKEAEAHGVAAATVAQLVSGTTDIEWIDVDPAAAAALKKVLNEVRAALAPPPPTPVPPPAPVVPPQPTPAAAEAPAAAPTTKPFNIAKQPTDKGAGIADEDCVITKLQAGGPAERAGLKVGMKIVKIAGNAVTTSAEIKQQLSTAGDAFVIDVEETASTPAPTLGFGGAAATPAFGDAKPAAAAFGAAEKKTTKPFNIAKQPTDKGAGIADKDCVITKLQAGGPAERAGLKVGMKIVKIAGNAVTTSAEIKQQLSTAGASFVIDVEDTASTPAPALGFGTPAAAATPAFGDTKPAATPFGATPAAAATAQVFTIAKQPTDKGAGIADQDCVITKLQAGGPAERAGLKVGMKITKVSGQAVATSQQVKQLLQASGPNFQIEAEKVPAANVPVFGAAAATPAPAVPAFGAAAATPAQPANPFGAAPAAAGTPQFGATAAVPPLGGAGAAQTFNIAKQPTDKGAGIADKDCVITKLQAGGPAERAGLKVGMKITKVGGQAVATSQQVKQLLQASGPNFQIEAEAPAGAAAAPAGFGVLGAAAAPAAATPAPFGAPPAAAAAPAAAGGFGVPPAAPAPFGAAPAAAPAFGAAPAVAGGTATFNIAKQPMDKGAGIADKDCVITKLQAGGPAERAGLRVGMKITKVGGQAVANSQQVKHMLQVSGPNFQIEAEAPAAGAAAPAAGFGVPGQPAAAAAANPFGAAAPAAAAAAPGPFGAQPAAAAAPGAFGAPPQAAAANPFGGAAAPAQQPAAAAAAANPFGGAAAPPGAAPGAFGAAPPGAAPFGAPPAAAPFGAQPAAAAPAFGAAAPAANPFGGAPVAAAPGFGAPAAAAAPFGGAPAQAPGAFGAPPTNPFGGAAAPAAAAQPGAFGAPAPAAAQAAGAGFGAPQAAAPFGGGGFAAAPAPAGNPFGAAPAAGGGFGAPAATPAPAFGAAPQAAAAAPFGTPAPAGGFGVPAQTPYGGGGGFGAQTPQPGGNPFGGGAAAQTPGAFATPQQPGRPYGEAATPMPPGGAGGWMQGPSPFASPMPR